MMMVVMQLEWVMMSRWWCSSSSFLLLPPPSYNHTCSFPHASCPNNTVTLSWSKTILLLIQAKRMLKGMNSRNQVRLILVWCGSCRRNYTCFSLFFPLFTVKPWSGVRELIFELAIGTKKYECIGSCSKTFHPLLKQPHFHLFLSFPLSSLLLFPSFLYFLSFQLIL